MDLKPHEIALALVAVAAPLIFIILAFTPGGLGFIGDIALNPVLMPWIFFGGAALVFCVLAFRIYRRIRPAAKKPKEAAAEHVTPTPKFTFKRDDGKPPTPTS
jgi:hypothetical protein